MKRWRDWALLKTSSLLPSGSFFDDRTLRLMAGPVLAMTLFGCSKEYEFVPQDPARGPGEMAGLSKALNTTFQGGASPDVQPRSVQGEPDWTTCNADCQAYCDAQPFQNPIDEAMCPFLWGAGLDTR